MGWEGMQREEISGMGREEMKRKGETGVMRHRGTPRNRKDKRTDGYE